MKKFILHHQSKIYLAVPRSCILIPIYGKVYANTVIPTSFFCNVILFINRWESEKVARIMTVKFFSGQLNERCWSRLWLRRQTSVVHANPTCGEDWVVIKQRTKSWRSSHAAEQGHQPWGDRVWLDPEEDLLDGQQQQQHLRYEYGQHWDCYDSSSGKTPCHSCRSLLRVSSSWMGWTEPGA